MILDDILDMYPDFDFLIAEGFDEAILGVAFSELAIDENYRLIYSVEKCIEIVEKRNKVTYAEALEYLEFNTFGAYVGDKSPIWCHDDF